MYLSSVEVENFRLFDSFHVELNKGLNLLIGENNSGKTTLIDVIRLVLDTNSAEWVRFNENDFHNGEDSLSIKLKFADLSIEDAAVFVEHLSHDYGDAGAETFLYVNLKATIGGNTARAGQYIKTEIRSGAHAEGTVIERDARMYLCSTYLKPLRDAQAELTSGRYSRLSQLLASTKSVGGQSDDIERLLKAVIAANQTIKDDESIQSAKGKVSDLLKKLTFHVDQFSPAIEMLGSRAFEDMTETEQQALFKGILERLSLNLDDTGKSHGLGYSNLLFMAAELMLLTQEGEGFPLLLIEEPEAHLHPQLQMKFLKYFTTEQSQFQCILSTHSPNLASKAPLDSIILMNQGKAYPLRKGCTYLDADDYPFLEKFLDVTKSNMFFAKGILMVEGDGENILLPTITELIGRPLEDYGVSIVNIGNLAYKRYAKIYRAKDPAATLPVRVACMTDLDVWPDKAELSSGNPVGFKEKKHPNTDTGRGGNLRYWRSHYDTPEKLALYKSAKQEHDGENVKTFISDEWTFEYCLARYGLAQHVYIAIHGSDDGYTDLPDDPEEKAIKIYGMIEDDNSGKTKATYRLSELLQEAFKGKPGELKNLLPPYIVAAVEHVTEPLESEVIRESGV
ncbi:ATP-dependent endonuclease [Endozoicomonas sp. ONNA1]|uniref:ATP-dependent nuclease n=1 Tax=Endozoicomonas sp. ONNA1 TaxID=2828740 RepID=UPI00214969FB|nr:AAA family ATPase [Endozoicomonas sp. ONNA1]